MGGIFERPKFIVNGEVVQDDFKNALDKCNDNLTIDWTALTSYFTYGFVSGDRTIFKEISRMPWMSEISDGNFELKPVPEHNLNTLNLEKIGDQLYDLLRNEIITATKNSEYVYILLSGGLDSRILAGVVAELHGEGFFKTKPKAFTWGIENSRDVFLARKTASILNLDWEHIILDPQTVLQNVKQSPFKLGLLHSPELLHAFLSIEKKTEENAIILAGSYGDSIGRGEFMGRHLLNLNINLPIDKYGLLKKEVSSIGMNGMKNDLHDLSRRSPTNFKWAKDELFMQGYRMRNGLSHALTVYKNNCSTYQVFTSQEVVQLIWSIHPSYRDDRLYEYLLESKLPQLSRIEWARTLKSIRGKKSKKLPKLSKDYHNYTIWSSTELSKELNSLVEVSWFKSKGIFNVRSLRAFSKLVRNSTVRNGRINEFWLYLAGFRILIDELESQGYKIDFGLHRLSNAPYTNDSFSFKNYFVATILSRSMFLNSVLKKFRMQKLKHHEGKLKTSALKEYPANSESD